MTGARCHANDARRQLGNQRRVCCLIDGPTFVARFLQHVLPPGFKRIRHYGLLSPAVKTARRAAARAALLMPAPNAQAQEDAAAFLKRVTGIDVACCPHCRIGRWRTIQLLPATGKAQQNCDVQCRLPP